MSKEWYEAEERLDSSADYVIPACDIVTTGQEVSVPAAEYIKTTENYDRGTAETTSDEDTRNRAHKKRMRKILYGLASMVMVVNMGKTIAGSKDILAEQMVWFNEYNEEMDYAQNGVIIVGGNDTIGGVSHVPLEFRHVDYSGNPIGLKDVNSYGYNGKWINANGYVLADTYGSNVYGVFNKKGEFLHEWQDYDLPGSNTIAAAISDNNIVFFQRNVQVDNLYLVRNSYYTVNGKELCSIDFDGVIDYNVAAKYGTPFRDGIAICNDNTGIVLVEQNGKINRLVDWPVVSEEQNIRERFQVGTGSTIEGSNGLYMLNNVPCVIVDGVSQGYFCVVDTEGNLALVNIDTGEMYKTELYGAQTKIENIGNIGYLSYSDNEGEMLHYGTRMCLVEEKCYLFDVTKHCDAEGRRTGYLACYDKIYFEDYQYLAVQDGADYFYIDLEGNKVSENYKKASTFNDMGYALVQTFSNEFYVIDSEFNKLERISKIDDFKIKDIGEVFCVFRGEESYSYYYGTNDF